MALKGNYSNYPVSSFGLYVEWSAVQSVVGNYSDVTQKIYLSYHQVDVGSRADSTSSINGTSVTYSSPAISDYTSGLKTKLLYTHTVRVYHASNGTAANIPLSASWRFGGTYAGVSIGTITANTSITLDTIDRSAPTVSLSATSITANSVVITATSNAVADVWDYSIDNGSTWYRISTTAGTTVSTTITGLSPNATYDIKVRARRQSNQVYGTSSAKTITTQGNTLLNSVNTFTVDGTYPILTMNWTVYDNYTHILDIKDGDVTLLSITDLVCSKGTNNITIGLTAEQRTKLLKYMANMQSFEATFVLSTFSGNTQIGRFSSKKATIQTTAALSAPLFVDFDHKDSDYNATVEITGNNQIYIKGCSTLQIELGQVTPINEATIASYRVTVGSDVKEFVAAYSTIDYGTINIAGDNISLKVEAIDSRGYATALTKTITVLDYEAISITSYSIRRKNEVEPTVQLSFAGKVSPIMIGDESKRGEVWADFRYAPVGGEMSSWISLNITETAQNFEFETTALSDSFNVLEFDSNKQYTIELRVGDDFTVDTLPITLNKGIPLVAYRSKKVGINNPNPQAALDIRGDGDLLKLNDSVVDYIEDEGVKNGWHYEKWHSGKAKCWIEKTYAGIPCTTSWGAMYETEDLGAIAYPFTFVEKPIELVSGYGGTYAFFLKLHNHNDATKTGTVCAMRPGAINAFDVTLVFDVKGYWK